MNGSPRGVIIAVPSVQNFRLTIANFNKVRAHIGCANNINEMVPTPRLRRGVAVASGRMLGKEINMKVWSGTSTESGTCLICGHKTGAYSEFKASGVRLKLYACEGQHLAFVQRQYARAMIEPLLMQARIIAHGRPGQGDVPNAEAHASATKETIA